MAALTEVRYRYLAPSKVVECDDGVRLSLSTSGGTLGCDTSDHPWFFAGSVLRPHQMATALLVVARVARTRFHQPPGMVAARVAAADPVVTSNGDRLRFEAFSACGGVHVRLDVLPGALDGPAVSTGTTNVDFNPPLRQLLARLRDHDRLHLEIGRDLKVVTLDGSVTERVVPLPVRWLKGFAEVQVVAAAMEPLVEIPTVEVRRFVASLPAGGGSGTAVWAVPAGRGLRLASRPPARRRGGHRDGTAVPLGGPDRLRIVAPVLNFATGMRAWADPDSVGPAPSVWQVDLVDARLTVTLSPEPSRGFSGEGGVLMDLAHPHSSADAALVAALLSYEPRLEPDYLARSTGLSPARVNRALSWLGAAGRVGFDVAEQAWFHRELPFDPQSLSGAHPRLVDAVALVEAGAVTVDPTTTDTVTVRSGDIGWTVRHDGGGYRCPCPWSARYGSSRGPCKHILAAVMATCDPDS